MSHTYNEEVAKIVKDLIIDKYYKMLLELYEKLKMM
jgi:hypothetical protein